MSSPEPNTRTSCPECGAPLPTKANYCWLCGKALRPLATAAAQPPAAFEHRAAYQFGLSTLMLIVTLCAVLLGVFRISPGVGLALVLLATPPLVRTCIATARRKARGQPVPPLTKLGIFASTLGIVIVVVAASIAAFWAVCLTIFEFG